MNLATPVKLRKSWLDLKADPSFVCRVFEILRHVFILNLGPSILLTPATTPLHIANLVPFTVPLMRHSTWGGV